MDFIVKNLNIVSILSSGLRDVVSDVNFSISMGQSLAIVGESGSGKTMTALAIFGLLPDNCEAFGEAELDGVDLISLSERKKNLIRGKDIVYIPQSGADFLNPSLKIRTQVYESLKKSGVTGEDALVKEAHRILNDAGLDETEQILSKYPFQISGGQAQRVVLAMSLVGNPRLVVADEPTKGIDKETANRFLDKLDTLFDSAAVIVITHDISVARRCDSVLVMKDGKVVEFGQRENIFCHPQQAYTKCLLSAENVKGFNA